LKWEFFFWTIWQIVVYLCVSKQELLHTVVREAYEVIGHEVGRSKRQYGRASVGTKKDEIEVLIENQEREIAELGQALGILEWVVHERKRERTKDTDPITPSADIEDERVQNFEDHFYSDSGQQSHELGTRFKTLVNRSIGVKHKQFKVDTGSGSDEDLAKHVDGVEEPNLPENNMMKLHGRVQFKSRALRSPYTRNDPKKLSLVKLLMW